MEWGISHFRVSDGSLHRFRKIVVLAICVASAGCAQKQIVKVVLYHVPGVKKGVPFIRVDVLDGVDRVVISGKDEFGVSMGGKDANSPSGKEWNVQLVQGNVLIETNGPEKGVVKDPSLPIVFSQKVKGGFVTVNGLPYRGRITVNRTGVNSLLVINELPIEDYLRSVVPSEMPGLDSTGIEAGKAQAVAARTYTVANTGKHREFGYDLASTTDDQVYSGVVKESPLTDKAVAETNGIIAMYRGRPIKAVYHSTCGGSTSSNEDAWFGAPMDYLRGRPDCVVSLFGSQASFCSNSPKFRWFGSWTREEFEQMVNKNLTAILGRPPRGTLTSIRVVSKDRYGRAIAVVVGTTESTYRVERGNIRKLFADSKKGWSMLPSNSFNLSFDGVTYTISGRGWGHGVGLCQHGAIGMSKLHYGYDRILYHYYRGIYLAKIY